ncbi:MAG: gliding motility lipoprotein GldB [Bacteroidota bacterium]
MINNVKLRQSYLNFLLKATGKHSNSVLLIFILLAITSCKEQKKPDVSHIKVDVKILRFEKDLYAGRNKIVEQMDSLLNRKYGVFYDDYVHRMVGDPTYNGTQILTTLYKDSAYTDLNSETQGVFKDMAQTEKDLSQAFKYIKYYYPKSRIPKFISFISGFSVQTPIGDDYMGIGLDMFLGKDSKFYKGIVQSVPTYISRRFSPEYIVPRITETFAREELFHERDEDRTLLSKMIQNGKILYFMDQVLDSGVPDSIKIGYTGKQIDWCKTYEQDIWGFFLENDLLFETDYQKIQVYLSEGPFTPGLGDKNESAPKLGIWVGWQIVNKYMQENKNITLQMLMTESDTQKLLTLSKYKPSH